MTWRLGRSSRKLMGYWPGKASPLGLRRSAIFDEAGAALVGGLERLDEALAGLEWSIAHQPELYPLVPGTLLRVAKLAMPGGAILAVYFTIELDQGLCTLHFIRAVDGP